MRLCITHPRLIDNLDVVVDEHAVPHDGHARVCDLFHSILSMIALG